MGGTNGTASGVDVGGELDNYCLDGFWNEWGIGGGGDSTGTPLAGQWYVGISLSDSVVCPCAPESGASTEGGLPAGSNVTSSYTKGMFSTGLMSGFADAQGASAYTAINGSSGVGKGMSLNRIFDTSWDLPGTVGSGSDVDTAAAAGRGITWSIHPTGTHFVSCSGDTPWGSVAAGCDDTGTYGLTSILGQLEAIGEHYHVPVQLAIDHEPHNNTSDWGTSGVGSCVAKSTCDGSSTEYRNMYHDVHNLLGAGDQNYPHVQLIYIAVDTNMSKNKVENGGGTCPGGTVAGCGDIDRPADADYDLLGADVYNYFKWCTTGGGTCTDSTGSWDDIASTGGGSARVNTVAKMGTVASGKGDIAVAAVHKKHILMTELGTHPGCPGGGTTESGGVLDGNVGHCATGDPTATKDQWFENFASTLASDSGYQTWFEGFEYFNNNHSISSGTVFDWQFVDRTGNSNNSESGCPSGVPCWTGLTGYKNLTVSGSTASGWFLNDAGVNTGGTFVP